RPAAQRGRHRRGGNGRPGARDRDGPRGACCSGARRSRARARARSASGRDGRGWRLTDEFSGTVEIAKSPQAAWAVIEDPLALGRALPGCESITPDGSGGLNVVVAIKQMFITVRVDLHVTYHDLDRPHHLRLALGGHPRGIGGALRLSVPIDIVPVPTGAQVDYHGTLELE